MKKIYKRKNSGFIFPIVLIIVIFLIVISKSVTSMNTAHSGDVSRNINRDKAYYIAYAGLEMAYSLINEPSPQGTLAEQTSNKIKNSKNELDKTEKKTENLEIKPDGILKPMGYVDLSITLQEKNNIWAFKILSKGKMEKNSNKPSDTHTLTMIVPVEAPNEPNIFEGNHDL